MGLFVSSQDYIFGANECVKKTINLCGHPYIFWCKKDSQEKIDEILVKIQPIIEEFARNNKEASFEKLLLMTLFDVVANVDNKVSETNAIKNDSDNNKNPNDITLLEQPVINDFVLILEAILSKI